MPSAPTLLTDRPTKGYRHLSCGGGRVLQFLHEWMPDSAVMSITNREAVASYHTSRWLLSPGGGGKPTEYQRI